MLRTAQVLVLLAAAVAACSKKSDPALSFETDADPSAQAPPPAKSSVVWRLGVDSSSAAHVRMAAARRELDWDATGAQGSFEVQPRDLAATRGGLMIDLATLAARAAGEGGVVAPKAAGSWLETSRDAGPGDADRLASFAIQSVDELSAQDVTSVVPVREGADDVRRVTMTVHGDLLIHGHKLQRAAKLAVAFHHGSGAPADSKPERVDVTSTAPVSLTLGEIGLGAGDAGSGKPAALPVGFPGKGPDRAELTVSVSARPTP